MVNQQMIKKALLIYGLCGVSIFLCMHYFGFLYSATDSLKPYHTFLHLRQVTPQKNDLTVTESAWYKSKIIKKIIGIQGDKISYQGGVMYVGGHKLGVAKAQIFNSLKLTPIPSLTIPKGFVFLGCDDALSFDSRYTQLGLVAVDKLKGKVIPLW